MQSKVKLADRIDVAVIGSGNGGLAAALCLYEMGVKNVSVFEKSDKIGGTSSLSGGGVWIPNNKWAKESGAEDSYAEALEYVLATDPDREVPKNMIETYLQEGPKMLSYLSDKTQMEYQNLEHYPDYFSELPGFKPGSRSIEPVPFDITQLENRGENLADAHPILRMFGRIPMTQTEAAVFNVQMPGWRLLAAKMMAKYIFDIPQRIRSRHDRRSTCGKAGVARLLISLQERDIPVHTNTWVRDIVLKKGHVTGIVVEKDGDNTEIACNKGVIVASGGFERNQALREKYLPGPTHHSWTTTALGNTGDLFESLQKQGAHLKRMNGAWWVPTFKVPGIPYAYPSVMEKSYPGSIVVASDGKRIANESMNYQLYVRECHKAQESGVEVDRMWLIFDSTFRKNYVVSPILTSKLMPDWMIPKNYFCDEFLTKSSSLDELAKTLGIHDQNLSQTVTRFNEFAKTGVDEDFGRGSTEIDRYYGDPSVTPNPCLAPIVKAPFYAVRIYLGEFGTNGGFDITTNAQVKTDTGKPIQGLYATGNCAAAVLAAYPGAGSTLGPSMTFAFQAAKHISGTNDLN